MTLESEHHGLGGAPPAGRTLLDMNAYQWTVLFAAWLGWGFDIFDSLLFNYVAPNAVPVLLDIPPRRGSPGPDAASLGIGGEWAAGAAMVAEVVPEHRRVEAGALLYTAAPLGLFLATIVTYQVQGVYFADNPEVS